MKYAVFFLLCCFALATAAPQYFTYPGYLGGGLVAPGYVAPGTVVAGPTVVNGLTGYTATAGRVFGPGFVL